MVPCLKEAETIKKTRTPGTEEEPDFSGVFAVGTWKKIGNRAEILGSRSGPFLETVYNSFKRAGWQEKPVRGCRCCPPGCNGALLFSSGRSCHSRSKKLVN